MPNIHKEKTISFRPLEWQRHIIDARVALCGLPKKEFIARSCIYSKIVVVGKEENIRKIINQLQEMQDVLEDIAGQIQTCNITIENDTFQDLRMDYEALIITILEILQGAEYLLK